jgi:hypothetical protein
VSVAESLFATAAGLCRGATSAVSEPLGSLEEEIDERLGRIPTHLNAYGYDAFGLAPPPRSAPISGPRSCIATGSAPRPGIDRLPQVACC